MKEIEYGTGRTEVLSRVGASRPIIRPCSQLLVLRRRKKIREKERKGQTSGVARIVFMTRTRTGNREGGKKGG